MQIKALIFYNKKGAKRILLFKTGRVNIITGESKTGKTAVIDIVNYCLGSDECRISEGVIRDTVEWFGILLQHEEEEIIIVRQNPNRLGQTSTQRIYFANSDTVEIPEFDKLQNNSDIASLKEFFTKKLFISEYTNNPGEGTREPLAVNFKHSRFYSFQPQDLIAQRNYLFYNQSEQFIPQTIKDSLPYFLGAIREDSMKIEQEITVKKRELSRLEKLLKDYERVYEGGSKKIYELVDEAKQLNLVSAYHDSNTPEQALMLLKEALAWDQTAEEVVQGENENLKKLIDEKTELEKQLSQKGDEVRAVNSFVKQASEYSSEVTQQKERLKSINLLQESNHDLQICPLCNHHMDSDIPNITAINKSLKELSENLTTTIVERPKLQQYTNKLIQEQDELKHQIELRQNGIRAIYLEKEESTKQREFNLRKGKIIGKISLFLESYQSLEEDKNLKLKIESIKSEIDKLEEMNGSDEKESKLNSILNQINTQMTRWSNKLDLEHKDAPIRFDIKKLTIFADTPTKSIPLQQMGSGANWVAYHLLIHMALHKHFVKANRPVPRFLILDQPSQAYYPPDKDKELNGNLATSTDEEAVRQMYNFIIDVTKELAPEFQVIITDHAKLNNDEFTACITEEWRNGKKLIPEDWIGL